MPLGHVMATPDFGTAVATIVQTWDDVLVRPHRFGGVEFRVGSREIGHVHVNGVADLLVSVRLRRDLVAAGRALPHHDLPQSGWISFRMRSEHDVPAAVGLFRLNYERLRGVGPKAVPSVVHGHIVMLGDNTVGDLPA
jgi:hypothetical protein